MSYLRITRTILVFSDTTNKTGILQQCEQNVFGDSPFGSITSNADRLYIFTNFVNEAYSRYAHLALTSDGMWQFEDTNYTDLPIGTTSLVSGQQDYAISTDQIIIEQVEIKDSAGIWHALSEIDERSFANNNASLSQHMISTIQGIPYEYQKVANSIFLNPTPNYASSGGLKIRFKRAPSYFVYGDTTKAQGFTSLHATYLSDYASWKYALSRGLDQVKNYQGLVQQWEQSTIPEFYNKRSEEHSVIIRPAYRTSR